MATNNALEAKVAGLEKSQEEAQGAVRRLSQENQNLISMLSKLNDELNKLRVELLNFKTSTEQKFKAQNQAIRYE